MKARGKKTDNSSPKNAKYDREKRNSVPERKIPLAVLLMKKKTENIAVIFPSTPIKSLLCMWEQLSY